MKSKIALIAGISIIFTSLFIYMLWSSEKEIKQFNDSLNADLDSQLPAQDPNDSSHLVKASYVDSLVKEGKLMRLGDGLRYPVSYKDNKEHLYGIYTDTLPPAKIKRAHKVKKDSIPMTDRGVCVTSYVGIMFSGRMGHETIVPANDSAEVDSLSKAYIKSWGMTGTESGSEVISKIKKHRDLLIIEINTDNDILEKIDSTPTPEPDHLSYEEIIARKANQTAEKDSGKAYKESLKRRGIEIEQ